MGCKGRFDTALMYKYMIKTVVQPHVKSFIPLNLSDWLKYTSACIDVCTFTSDIKNVHVCIAVALTGVPEGINIQGLIYNVHVAAVHKHVHVHVCIITMKLKCSYQLPSLQHNCALIYTHTVMDAVCSHR